jgi:hypothetical protein
MPIAIPTYAQVAARYAANGFIFHTEPMRPNLLFLRKTPGTLDAFDDMAVLAWIDHDGARRLFAARATTDPGKPILEHPKRKDGAAVWALGQQIDLMGFGLHHGKTPCLVPLRPVPVLRYTSPTDPTGTPSTSTATQIHPMGVTHESTVVGSWSEGCMGLPNPKDWSAYWDILVASKAAGWHAFSVTVVEEKGT